MTTVKRRFVRQGFGLAVAMTGRAL
jgi:hypothetical protein